MITLVRWEDGRLTAQACCDVCGIAAMPPTGVDAAELLRDARHLRSLAAVACKWYRVGYQDGHVGLVCPRCWKASVTIIKPRRPRRPRGWR